MKNVAAVLAISVVLILSVYGCTETTLQSNSVVLFSSPVNEAQKLANFIVANNEAQQFNVGSQDEGVSYSRKLYIASKIYEVEVHVYKNGQNSLHINYYLTNRSLEKIKTPADLIAQELMYGRSEIHIEEHISDYGTDMSVDIYQTFMNKRGSTYEGFTRAERDSKIAGVQEYIYYGGKELQNGTWKIAPKKTFDEITGYYKEVLAELLGALGKN